MHRIMMCYVNDWKYVDLDIHIIYIYIQMYIYIYNITILYNIVQPLVLQIPFEVCRTPKNNDKYGLRRCLEL